MPYENVLTAERGGGVPPIGFMPINRPKQPDGLSDALMDESGGELNAYCQGR
jgi:hypothetical protein